MSLYREINTLLRKEFLLEMRNKSAFWGLMLYCICTIFMIYLAFKVIEEPRLWYTLLWIISLFTATSAIVRSFVSEPESRNMYYYQLVSPQAIILSKLIFNGLLMLLLSAVTFGVYSIVIPPPNGVLIRFFVLFLVGGLAFSNALTLIASIASQTNNASALMVVLGFPVIVPTIVLLIKMSKSSLMKVPIDWYQDLIFIGAINIILIALSFILFPYLYGE